MSLLPSHSINDGVVVFGELGRPGSFSGPKMKVAVKESVDEKAAKLARRSMLSLKSYAALAEIKSLFSEPADTVIGNH